MIDTRIHFNRSDILQSDKYLRILCFNIRQTIFRFFLSIMYLPPCWQCQLNICHKYYNNAANSNRFQIDFTWILNCRNAVAISDFVRNLMCVFWFFSVFVLAMMGRCVYSCIYRHVNGLCSGSVATLDNYFVLTFHAQRQSLHSNGWQFNSPFGSLDSFWPYLCHFNWNDVYFFFHGKFMLNFHQI